MMRMLFVDRWWIFCLTIIAARRRLSYWNTQHYLYLVPEWNEVLKTENSSECSSSWTWLLKLLIEMHFESRAVRGIQITSMLGLIIIATQDYNDNGLLGLVDYHAYIPPLLRGNAQEYLSLVTIADAVSMKRHFHQRNIKQPKTTNLQYLFTKAQTKILQTTK